MDQNHLSNFGRGQLKNHLFEIILILDQGFRRTCHLSQVLTDDEGWRLITKTHLVTTMFLIMPSANFTKWFCPTDKMVAIAVEKKYV